MQKRFLILPLIYLFFAAISLTIIQSIAPVLVQYQALFFVIGALIFTITSTIPLNTWKRLSPLLYVGMIIFLIIPLAFGIVTRGSRGWIPIGPFNLQPSQFSQPIALLLLSFFLTKHSMKEWKNLVLASVMIGLPLLLIFIEPDFGTFAVLSVALSSIIFFSDIPFSRILFLSGIMIVLSGLVWTLLLQPYQKQRITTFFSSEETQVDNYNAVQSLIAVGSGQVWGRGLGHGVQSQLRFLPERQTDFIFASLAEETGFIGVSLLLSLYFILLIYIFLVAQRHKYRSPQQLFLLGAASLLFIQIFINVGMNSGIMPITGITLPFISYGGSSLLSFAFLFGLIQHIVINQHAKHFRQIR